MEKQVSLHPGVRQLSDINIGVIGFGKMGSAMVNGWLSSGVISPKQIHVCARNYDALVERTSALEIEVYREPRAVVEASDIVVLAVKPHLINDVLAKAVYAPTTHMQSFISVAWGYTKDQYGPIARQINLTQIMPNLPVSVCEGVILVGEQTLSLHVALDTKEQAALTHLLSLQDELLALLGTVVPVESDVFAISGAMTGCTPAFFAMVIEALGDCGVRHGLKRADAYQLASLSMKGTAALLAQTGQLPAQLKDEVCSPNGATIRGVTTLEKEHLRAAMIAALDAVLDPNI